jgi:hypothetical protein
MDNIASFAPAAAAGVSLVTVYGFQRYHRYKRANRGRYDRNQRDDIITFQKRCSRLQYSPANSAFAIWSPIYAISLLSWVPLIGVPTRAQPLDVWYSWLFAASWLTTCAWGVAGRDEKLHARFWIACSLVAGSLLGYAALLRARNFGNDYGAFVLITTPCALLTGWLACASLLGVGLYFKPCSVNAASVLNIPDVPSIPPDPTPSLVPLAASVAICGLALFAHTPVLMVGVLVLTVTQRSGPATVHALAVTTVAIGSALAVFVGSANAASRQQGI